MAKKRTNKEKVLIAKVPRKQLEEELIQAREILKILGAAYYASHITASQLGKGRLPLQVPMPTVWLQAAHLFCEGRTLQDPTFSISEGNPEDSYVAFFEDSQGNTFVFTHNLDTGATTLRAGETDEEVTDLPNEPEAHLWFQSAMLAAVRKRAKRIGGKIEITYTAWDIIMDIACQFRAALEQGKPVNREIPLVVMERAHSIAGTFVDKVRGVLIKPGEGTNVERTETNVERTETIIPTTNVPSKDGKSIILG